MELYCTNIPCTCTIWLLTRIVTVCTNSVGQQMYDLDDTSDWFWEIIVDAKQDREKLTVLLQQLSKEEIIRFQYEFESTLFLAWSNVSAQQDISESGAFVMCGWLASQGKEYFANALVRPGHIPELEAIDIFEDLSGVAGDVYLLKFEEFLPVPAGGYWGFLSDPWIDEIEGPENEPFLGDLAEGLSIHREYVRRLSRKTDKSGNE